MNMWIWKCGHVWQVDQWTCAYVKLWTRGPVELLICGLVDLQTCGPVCMCQPLDMLTDGSINMWTYGPVNIWNYGLVSTCGPVWTCVHVPLNPCTYRCDPMDKYTCGPQEDLWRRGVDMTVDLESKSVKLSGHVTHGHTDQCGHVDLWTCDKWSCRPLWACGR